MILFLVLAGFFVAALAPWLTSRFQERTGWLLAVYPGGVFLYLQSLAGRIAAGGMLRESHALLPQMDISLSFAIDGWALLFGLLVSGIGALVTVYAGGYLKGHPLVGRFFAFLMIFMSAMLGIVLAGDLIALFVFWELTSISSYMLIGFHHEEEKSRESALQALLVTGGGGLALLAGLLLLGNVAGTFEISAIRQMGPMIRGHSLYVPIFVLVALGAFTKSAQFPFHFWLPNAMVAPTPVSAFLHSATMVKAGIYLLARLDVVLGGTEVWTWTLGVVGLLTMTLGAFRAVRETDLKRILAYSTITALGMLTLLIGLSFEDALKAAVVFLVVHSLYKGALFMVAGNVDHETGTRDVTRLGGLRSKLPVTSKAALVAACSMAGFPPLFGFIGKELAYKAKLGLDVDAAWWVPALGVLANALTVTAALVVALRPFWGELRHLRGKEPHEAPLSMLVGPVVLAGYCLLLGIYPGQIEQRLVAPAVLAILGQPMKVHLALWYGVNLALLLSAITVVLGVLGYVYWDRIRQLLALADPIWNSGAEAGYRLALGGLVRLADAQTRMLMAGGLRRYLLWIFLVVAATPTAALLLRGGVVLPDRWPQIYFTEWVLVMVIAVAASAVTVAPSRFTAVACIGVVGFTVALLFEILSAPDLAITQLMVETLFVVIVVLALQRLPRLGAARSLGRFETARNVLVAVAVGSIVTLLCWSVTALPFNEHVSEFYNVKSVPAAYGRNVVNVVLVDFRATDTLGEITVLAVAAMGVHVLVKVCSAPSSRDTTEKESP